MAITGTESRFQNMKVLAEELEVNGTAITGAGEGLLPVTTTVIAGTLTGTTDGTMEDVADIALSTSDTYTDAAVNTAVNAAILSLNLQLKELQTKLNELIAALD